MGYGCVFEVERGRKDRVSVGVFFCPSAEDSANRQFRNVESIRLQSLLDPSKGVEELYKGTDGVVGIPA